MVTGAGGRLRDTVGQNEDIGFLQVLGGPTGSCDAEEQCHLVHVLTRPLSAVGWIRLWGG